MSDRRSFLKSTVIVAGGLVVGKASTALAKTVSLPSGIIYTAKDAGQWEKKIGTHAPKVSRDGKTVTILTSHPMTQKHYIVRHTLVADDGTVIGAKTFYPTYKKAISTYTLPDKPIKKLYATSFCNKHDFWMTEVEIS